MGIRGTAPQSLTVDDKVLEAMEAFGATAQELDAAREAAQGTEEASPSFGIYAENVPTVQAFLALTGTWQYAGMHGQRTGMDWKSVEAWIDRHIRRRRRRKGISSGVMVMQHAVLQADAETRQKEA